VYRFLLRVPESSTSASSGSPDVPSIEFSWGPVLSRRSSAIALALGVVFATLTLTTVAGPARAAVTMRPAPSVTASFAGHGSVGQAYVVGVSPGLSVALADASGHQVGKGRTDGLGSLVIRSVSPGSGYTFRVTQDGKEAATAPFRVLAPTDTPGAAFYSGQMLHVGLNYLTMRDGVKLAVTVRLPFGATMADAPFPTVVEDSGYAIAGPHSLIDAVLHRNGAMANDPLLPSTSTAVGSIVAPLLGFATISLQMRGSGCSGGAFDLFGLPTTYDGYDAVQIAASQPWVAHHKVGLVGISFSGISQLFVAGTRPPGLAAVAPMSLTDDLYSTGFPGGMYNSGFAGSWLADRIADAKPAPTGGQTYARTLIQQGDATCLANQELHGQAQDLTSLLNQASHRDPGLYDQRAPITWAAKTQVPVFLSGAFQDEQTGGQWPAIVSSLAKDPDVWVTMVNGTHTDSLGPGTISRWLEFLDIFVAQQVPRQSALLNTLAPLLYGQLASAPSATPPPLQFTDATDVAAARRAFEAQPRVRVLMDNGSGSKGPGALQPVWQVQFPSWPPPSAVATTLHLGPGGSLARATPVSSTVTYRPDPAVRPTTDLPTGNVWAATPPYVWKPVTGPSGLGFSSAPLAKNITVIGPASLDVWVKSTAPDTDLQATVSEVRPDGAEMFVQSGTLRASDRALDAVRSTATHPVPTYLLSTAKPLPRGRFSELRVPILPFAYSFRAGSRIRVTVTAPGGDRPAWVFDTLPTGGTVTDTVGLGGSTPSALVLSVVPGIAPQDTQPACPSLRGQPCRAFAPARNGG
jgi:predicted acyl esterase